MTFGLDRTARHDRSSRPVLPAASVVVVIVLWLAALVAASAPAAAQRGAFSNQSSVVVDYSVLDQLGPAPTVPQVLMPRPGSMTPAPPPGYVTSPVLRQGATAGERIVLKPPKGVSKRKARRGAKARSRTRTAARTKKKAAPRRKAKAKSAEVRTAARTPEPPMSAPPPPPPPAMAPPPPAPNAARRIAPAPSVPAVPEPTPVPPPMTAVPAAPMPPTAPTPPKPPTRTAALTPSSASVAPGQSLRVGFGAGSAQISPEAAKILKQVAKGMASDDKLRIQLLAYAAGADSAARQARRLSLSRALAARSFLIGEGVRSTRIDVRALGNKSEGGPPDRIDIVVNRR